MKWSPNPAFDMDLRRREDALTALRSAASERILIIDGAMGTQIQCLNLGEKQLPRRSFSFLRSPFAGQQ